MKRCLTKSAMLVLMILLAVSATMAASHETEVVATGKKATASATAPMPRLDSAIAAMQANGAGEGTVPATTAAAAPTAGEEINWSVIGAGGQLGTSTNWIVSGTVGQSAVGSATSTNYSANHGFWQIFSVSGPGCCTGIVGDANGGGDYEPSIGDVSCIIDAKFISMTCDAIPCLAEADINQSGGPTPTCDDITLGDILYLIDYLFITGPSLGIPECL